LFIYSFRAAALRSFRYRTISRFKIIGYRSQRFQIQVIVRKKVAQYLHRASVFLLRDMVIRPLFGTCRNSTLSSDMCAVPAGSRYRIDALLSQLCRWRYVVRTYFRLPALTAIATFRRADFLGLQLVVRGGVAPPGIVARLILSHTCNFSSETSVEIARHSESTQEQLKGNWGDFGEDASSAGRLHEDSNSGTWRAVGEGAQGSERSRCPMRWGCGVVSRGQCPTFQHPCCACDCGEGPHTGTRN